MVLLGSIVGTTGRIKSSFVPTIKRLLSHTKNLPRNMQVRAPASENIAPRGGGIRRCPRPNRRRGAAGRHIIVLVIVNVALEGRENQTVATTRLRPRPFPLRALSSRFERCQRQSQDSAGEREEGHRPKDGQRGCVRSRARLPPPLCDATV
jgi:hypothetical protein